MKVPQSLRSGRLQIAGTKDQPRKQLCSMDTVAWFVLVQDIPVDHIKHIGFEKTSTWTPYCALQPVYTCLFGHHHVVQATSLSA
jgi:hypothetical protein